MYSWECGFVTSSDELKQKRHRRKGWGEAVNGAEEGRGDPLDLFSAGVVGGHLPSPGGRSGEDAASKMWRWLGGGGGGPGRRGRGVTTGFLHTRLGPKRIILGSLGKSRPLGQVCLFSDSQAPWPRHPSAAYSSSNGSAIANGETTAQLPIWGGKGRLRLSWKGHKAALPHKQRHIFYFELFKLYFLKKNTNSPVLCKFFF